jgi:hypothetical protein
MKSNFQLKNVLIFFRPSVANPNLLYDLQQKEYLALLTGINAVKLLVVVR